MKIKIYNDLGVSKESAAHCLYSLKLHLPRCCSVGYISAQEIITGHGLKQTYLFVLPGGRDLYYKQKLQGKGNQYIQDYISKGGNFLGICAGSYYSGRYLVFAPGTPIEVVEPRPLGLFQGVVKGPVLAPYYYGSHKGASAARVLLIDHTPQKVCYVFYNGGGYFARADRISGTTVIGRYENGEAAIIQSAYGAGKVILSGVHVEYDPTLFDTTFPKSIRNTLHNHNKERAILFKHILKMLQF